MIAPSAPFTYAGGLCRVYQNCFLVWFEKRTMECHMQKMKEERRKYNKTMFESNSG